MKIAIHKSKSGFHPRWKTYCEEQNIDFKLVDCYDTNLIENLKDCYCLFWHHSQGNPADIIIAKQILFALEHTEFKVFPDFKTSWHFDDKVAQKYLFERLDLPCADSYVFFDKKKALEWIEITSFPKVFKLRGGAGAANVSLVKNKVAAKAIINKAFDTGFKNYDARSNLKERFRKWRNGKANFYSILKGFVRFIKPPLFSKVAGREIGYVYFQDFMANNSSDIRVVVIDNKAFALKRYVRANDFRASGSGNFAYAKEEFDERCITLAFEATAKIKTQCGVYDFVFDAQNNPLFIEISYGFTASGYDDCPGYWDNNLNWHEGTFNPQGWMIDLVIKSNFKIL